MILSETGPVKATRQVTWVALPFSVLSPASVDLTQECSGKNLSLNILSEVREIKKIIDII